MMTLAIVTVVACIFIAGLYSGSETGGYLLNRVRLHYYMEEKQPRAMALNSLLEDPRRLMFTVLVGHNLVVYIASNLVTELYVEHGLSSSLRLVKGVVPWNAEVAATVTLLLPIFILAEIGPKNFFRKRANSAMYDLAYVLRSSYWAFLPVSYPLRRLSQLLPSSIEASAREELLTMTRGRLSRIFADGASEGVLTSHQNRMVHSVMSLNQLTVQQVMTPIEQAALLPDTATVGDFREALQRHGGSRVGLYQHNRHQVVGYLHMFDVMKEGVSDESPLLPLKRTIVRVRVDTTVQDAFYQLQRGHHHLAFVLDRQNRAIGTLTLAAIAERIIGM